MSSRQQQVLYTLNLRECCSSGAGYWTRSKASCISHSLYLLIIILQYFIKSITLIYYENSYFINHSIQLTSTDYCIQEAGTVQW